MKLVIGYLYPDLMNMYGDYGNVICLIKRCQWRNIEVEVKNISLKEKLDYQLYDLIFMGGGQDKEQRLVSLDLQKFKESGIRKAAEKEVVILGICGAYQLFGYYYKTKKGDKIPGVGILDAYTIAGDKRMIGNTIIKINPRLKIKNFYLDTLVGFENHSGKTFLGEKCQPLGKVKVGYGNNGEDKNEGAFQKNVFGTYLHGAFLPKNPHFADFLISKALARKHGPLDLQPIDDELEIKAHKTALKIAQTKKTLHL